MVVAGCQVGARRFYLTGLRLQVGDGRQTPSASIAGEAGIEVGQRSTC